MPRIIGRGPYRCPSIARSLLRRVGSPPPLACNGVRTHLLLISSRDDDVPPPPTRVRVIFVVSIVTRQWRVPHPSSDWWFLLRPDRNRLFVKGIESQIRSDQGSTMRFFIRSIVLVRCLLPHGSIKALRPHSIKMPPLSGRIDEMR